MCVCFFFSQSRSVIVCWLKSPVIRFQVYCVPTVVTPFIAALTFQIFFFFVVEGGRELDTLSAQIVFCNKLGIIICTLDQ